MRLRLLALVVLGPVLIAGGARLYRLDALGLLVDRDVTSALFARHLYHDRTDGSEAWRNDVARVARERQPIPEPPVTEWLAGA